MGDSSAFCKCKWREVRFPPIAIQFPTIMTDGVDASPKVFLALPKGHMQESIFTLLKECGYTVSNGNSRGYKPSIAALPHFDIKLLKVRRVRSGGASPTLPRAGPGRPVTAVTVAGGRWRLRLCAPMPDDSNVMVGRR